MPNLLKTLIIPAFLLLGCNGKNKSKLTDEFKSGEQALNLQLTDLNNKAVRLEDYKGKTVFINFWATWCKPCIEEMPSIEKAQARISDKETVFLFASSESIEEIKEFRNNHSYEFNYVHLEKGEQLNLQALPTTFIINPKGILVFSEMGSRNWDDSTNINLIKNITKQHD